MKNIVGNNQREIIRLNKKPIITVEIFYNSLFGKEIFMNKKLFNAGSRFYFAIDGSRTGGEVSIAGQMNTY